jgi:hypothetical protein
MKKVGVVVLALAGVIAIAQQVQPPNSEVMRIEMLEAQVGILQNNVQVLHDVIVAMQPTPDAPEDSILPGPLDTNII